MKTGFKITLPVLAFVVGAGLGQAQKHIRMAHAEARLAQEQSDLAQEQFRQGREGRASVPRPGRNADLQFYLETRGLLSATPEEVVIYFLTVPHLR